ncbi:GNAT family N-acetyltransferase [Andreprevotia sp. IGB-42]|uniref:GNAT family N-acetyltransferase n=1 Tax=Andreprevotia sp. IGB-42 TaxID=2497473 RepID=UPI00191F6181|nr:GNAT family N-acetyltransferase [Andreprevotia sp. IGB-42]
MAIRLFSMADYADAAALWTSIPGVTLNEADTPEAITAFLARNPGLSFVATDRNGQLIGTVLCGHNGRAGHLYHLAVAPSHRNRGVGRALVERCFNHLAAAHIPRCNIFVYADNDVGNAFWLKAGWDDPATWKVLQKHVQV